MAHKKCLKFQSNASVLFDPNFRFGSDSVFAPKVPRTQFANEFITRRIIVPLRSMKGIKKRESYHFHHFVYLQKKKVA